MKHKCLSIAGFDGSGGAGLQADLKTFSAFGCYGMTILTALPVQNTCGVKRCYRLPLSSIDEQLETIFTDITPDAIKIGMLFSADIVHCVADFLEKNAKHIPIVVDPVMIAKSGDPLLESDAIHALIKRMLPLASLITPNLPEAQALSDNNSDDIKSIAQQLRQLGADAVLLKGGHCGGDYSNDLLLDKNGQSHCLEAKRIDSPHTHGTGCTLSAAICAGLSLGLSMLEACQLAKKYLWQAILAAQHHTVGKGHGPVHHFYHLWPSLEKIQTVTDHK